MYKHIFENKKAIIFDLNGTFVDSKAHWHQAYINVAKELNLYVSTDLKTQFLEAGLSVETMWQKVVELGLLDHIENVQNLEAKTYNQFIQVMEEYELKATNGAWQFLSELKLDKDFKVGLVTNSPRNIAQEILIEVGAMETFDVIVCGDDVEHEKPSQDMYLKAINELVVKKEETLVFEDSIIGANAAVNSELETIIVWDGSVAQTKYPLEVAGYVPDFTNFPGNLDKSIEELLNAFAQKRLEAQGIQTTPNA